MTRHYFHQLIRSVTAIQSSSVHLLPQNFDYSNEFPLRFYSLPALHMSLYRGHLNAEGSYSYSRLIQGVSFPA